MLSARQANTYIWMSERPKSIMRVRLRYVRLCVYVCPLYESTPVASLSLSLSLSLKHTQTRNTHTTHTRRYVCV
jgi:hypothetical protein